MSEDDVWQRNLSNLRLICNVSGIHLTEKKISYSLFKLEIFLKIKNNDGKNAAEWFYFTFYALVSSILV